MHGKLSMLKPRVPLELTVYLAYFSVTVWSLLKVDIFLASYIMEDPELLQPLESVIRQQFIPALTGKDSPGDLMRELLALPASLGGLSITNPITISAEQHSTSKLISAPLVKRVIEQDHQLGDCHGQPVPPNALDKKKLPKTCTANFLHPFNTALSFPKKRVRPLGCLLSQLMTMASPYISPHLEMHCLFVTTGPWRTHHPAAAVVISSLLIMLCHAQQVAFRQSGTMRWGT